MFSVFVLKGVMSEEGQLVVEQYDHDTRPDNLNSLHTFQTDADALTYMHGLVRPLFPPDASRTDVANLLGQIRRDLEASKLFMVSAAATDQVEEAIHRIEDAQIALTRHLMAGSPAV